MKLRQPTTGAVRVDGVDTSGMSAKALAHLRNERLGMMFQSSNLFPSLTAVQQVELVERMSRPHRSTRPGAGTSWRYWSVRPSSAEWRR